jgi:hypothetical protein
MKHLIIALFFLLGVSIGNALAGEIKEIELTDGSVIYGEIVSFSGGTFTLRSESFGTMRVLWGEDETSFSSFSKRC